MKYRKKPVVIEAIQYDGTENSFNDCLKFLSDGNENFEHLPDSQTEFINKGIGVSAMGIEIPTLEGVMLCKPCDYIIKGIAGEFYPCKPDIFESTYEKVEESNL